MTSVAAAPRSGARPLDGALVGTKVLEVGTRLSGAYVGLVLSGLGAEVARVDLPYDTSSPATAVFVDRGRLVVPQPPGDGTLLDLIALADVLVTDLPPHRLRELGLPTCEDEVEVLRPGLVHVAITSFGLDGPHADFVSDDITEWAAGGLAYLTRRPAGGPDGAPPAPVLPPGRQPDMLAGIAASVGVLAALREVAAARVSVLVDVSRQEVQASMSHHAFPALVWANELLGAGGSPLASIGMLVPTADGQVYLRAVEDRQWLALADWIGIPPDIATERVGGMLMHHRDSEQVRSWVEPWAATHPTSWLVTEGQARRVPIADPNSLQGVLASPQLAERGAWVDAGARGTGGRVPAVPLVEPAERLPSRTVSADELLQRWSR